MPDLHMTIEPNDTTTSPQASSGAGSGDASNRRCVATSTRTGKPCRRWAIAGGTVCPAHGGSTKRVKAAAARRLAMGEAMAELDRIGRPIDIDPADAMLDMVREAAGNVAFLRARVQELRQVVSTDLIDSAATAGIAGRTGSTTKFNEAAPHVLVTMYDAERERLVRWAKACRDAGVDERRVQVAEEQGRQLADVLRGTVAGLLELVLRLVAGSTVTEAAVREAWDVEAGAIVRRQIQQVTTNSEGAA